VTGSDDVFVPVLMYVRLACRAERKALIGFCAAEGRCSASAPAFFSRCEPNTPIHGG